jgi:hypothetical protein
MLLRLMVRSLGANHPIRLAIGISVGVLLKMIVDALAASFPFSEALRTFAGYQSVWFIAVCAPVYTENLIRVDELKESPKLTE